MPTRPDDLKGWELLAFHETELRNYSAAADAQARVIALSDGGSDEELVRLADLLVAAADGFVSKEAEEVARELLRLDDGRELTLSRRYRDRLERVLESLS